MPRPDLCALAFIVMFATLRTGHAQMSTSGPPVAAQRPVVDNYFGTKITDPYRWMESEPKPEFFDYLHGQNAYARAVLAAIPGRDALAREVSMVSGINTRVRTVALANGQVFFLRRGAGEEIDRLYVRDQQGHETLLVDPTSQAKPGSHAEIDQIAPSMDGRMVAYGVSSGGSENSTLHVVDAATGHIHPDSIDRAQFASVAWLPDGKGFFYSRLAKGFEAAPAVEQYAHMKVYQHTLAGDPAADRLILDADNLPFAFKAAQIFPALLTVPGSDYVEAVIADGVSPEIAIHTAKLSELEAGHPSWQRIVEQSDGVITLAVKGTHLALLTHKNAQRFKVVQTSLDAPDFDHANTLVPEGTAVVTDLVAASDAFYYASRDGAVFHLHRLAQGAISQTIPLPFEGTIEVPGGSGGGLVSDPAQPGLLVELESWVHPDTWLRYEPKASSLADAQLLPVFPRNLSAYTSVETSATAPDGTRIPLSIIMKNTTPHDGKRPTYLVGYGAYGISYDPQFNPNFLPWLDHGGVYAVAHVRGGGEGGQAWHDGGKIATKQNTIHDFIACAGALIAMRLTDPAHLGGEGTSAGGILIGGAITQQPGLFRAALIRVGSTNTVREEYTAGGPANIPEFGTVKDRSQFPALLAMDANNNVKSGVAYPAVLLTGGANDPRVTVWIPAKMTAKLQAATSSGRPVLFRVEFDAGHGIGSTRSQRDMETSDEFAFLLWQFGDPAFQPKLPH